MAGRGRRKALHSHRKSMASPLSQELREEYGRRSLPVRVGDKVRVSKGDFKGLEGKVTGVDTKDCRITVEGVETAKVDGSDVPNPIHPSNVTITELERDDRRGITVEKKSERRPESGEERSEETSKKA
ncbi:hypothetical protein AKJ45_00470 [candidate division MSBL1 archaeon SCGC-AAA261F19]|uniref:Large ribosomal subunit protein uL24 n=2 Tax=candidate division MSBL1 TaxID=215777 RepID=A0A133VBK3_9EURY|nr:hypothetical protein AKJ43_00465 [candidate division MSBL1 archaeon SCGC-AAA261D19]KXB03795.1 hypothetical protein AKJ45_00470 [candidate division MSBL1 archaeon SCGC-AAA261F19]